MVDLQGEREVKRTVIIVNEDWSRRTQTRAELKLSVCGAEILLERATGIGLR